MNGNSRKDLPNYLEVTIGDTVYTVSSIFADKGNFRNLREELIIDHATRLCDCKTA